MIDYYVVEAPQGSTIDWLVHAVADSVSLGDAPSTQVEMPLGIAEGYEHLTEVARGPLVDRDLLCRFQAGANQLRVWLAADSPQNTFTAKCPGYNLEPRLPCLLRRATGGRVAFATVYDWAEGDRQTLGLRIVNLNTLELRRASKTTEIEFLENGVQVNPPKQHPIV